MFKRLKGKFIISAVISSMLLLTACGDKSVEAPKNEATVNETNTQAEEGTRIVKTTMGDVEVPVNPKRVMVDYVVGDVVALGVTPIGVRSSFEGSAYDDLIKDSERIDKWDPEKLMSLEPDLIISVSAEEYEQSSKIAPTIFVPFTEISKEERLSLLGEVLGKEEEAKKLLEDYDKKIEEAKVLLTEKGILDKTISIFFNNPTDVIIAGDKWGRGGDIIYNDLGFKAVDVVQKEIVGGDQYRNLSLEMLPEYTGDYMVFDWDPALFDNTKIWDAIPAYKEGRKIALDFALFYPNDIYSQGKQLEFLVENLIEVTENK